MSLPERDTLRHYFFLILLPTGIRPFSGAELGVGGRAGDAELPQPVDGRPLRRVQRMPLRDCERLGRRLANGGSAETRGNPSSGRDLTKREPCNTSVNHVRRDFLAATSLGFKGCFVTLRDNPYGPPSKLGARLLHVSGHCAQP